MQQTWMENKSKHVLQYSSDVILFQLNIFLSLKTINFIFSFSEKTTKKYTIKRVISKHV